MIESTSELLKAFVCIKDFSLDKAETLLNQFAEHIANFATLRTGVVYQQAKRCSSMIGVIGSDLCGYMLSFVRPDDLEGLVHVCKTFHQGIMKLAWKECYIDRMKSNYSFGISLPPVLDFEEYCSQNLDLYSNSPWCKHVEKLTIELQRLDAYDLDDDLDELFDFVKQLKSLKRLRVLVLESDGNFEVQKFCADVVSFHSNKMEELQIDFGRYRGDQSRFCLREDFLKSISKSQLKSFSITLGHYIDESKILNALPNSITNLTLMLGSHTVINFSVLAELRLDFLKIVDGVVPKDELSPFTQTIRKVSSLVLELVSCPSDDFEKALRDSLDNLKKLVLEVKEEDIKSIVLLKCSQNLESAILTGPKIVAGLDISEMSPKLQYLQIADYRCPKDIAQKLIDHAKEKRKQSLKIFSISYRNYGKLDWTSSSPGCTPSFGDNLEKVANKYSLREENSLELSSKKRKR
jgi:hypothetical protein